MRFDSAEFDDDCLDDIACGEQCSVCGDDLDVALPEEDDFAAAMDDMLDDAADMAEDVMDNAADAA